MSSRLLPVLTQIETDLTELTSIAVAKYGFKTDMGGDPRCWFYFVLGGSNVSYAGSGGIWQLNARMRFLVEGRDGDQVTEAVEALPLLWRPGSANFTALSALGVESLQSHGLPFYAPNVIGDTAEDIIAGVEFDLQLRYSGV